MTRLFLSFSVGGDNDGRDFMRQLFDRCRQHGIDTWVYESPRGEIASGDSISVACRRKIEESDLFVVFINDGALQSDYVNMEVSHALWEQARRPLPIVPLVATHEPKQDWPVAMAEASDFKGILLPRPAVGALENVVVHLCERLRIPYVPPTPQAPRLPLRQRLADELQAGSSLSGYGVGDFISVLRKCDLATDALGTGDYDRARRLLESILTDVELDYGVTKPYYPRVVYGAVLLAEAHAGRRAFLDAERHFAAVIEEDDPRLDANAFAGRANALMALGRFEEALVDYQKAEEYLENPDSALLYNLIRARGLGGLSMDRGEIGRRRAALEDGLVTRMPGDLARLTASLSLAYAYVGDITATMDAWRDIGDIDAVFPELTVDIAQQLHRHGVERESPAALAAAHVVISQYVARRSDLSTFELLPLQHLWSRIMFDRGERARARQHLASLIAQFPATPVLHIDAAMFALADGDRRSARQLCNAVTSFGDYAQCVPALTSREFNLALGHAFWLLGRRSEAQESFRRSGCDQNFSYGVTLQSEFGLAHFDSASQGLTF